MNIINNTMSSYVILEKTFRLVCAIPETYIYLFGIIPVNDS